MFTLSRRGYRKSDKILVSSIKNFPYVKKVCLELMILSTLKLKAHIMFGVWNSSADYLYITFLLRSMICAAYSARSVELGNTF